MEEVKFYKRMKDLSVDDLEPSFNFPDKNVGIYLVPDETYKPSKFRKFFDWLLRKPNPVKIKVSGE